MAKFSQPPREQSHFSKVPAADIPRSRFDRSHGHKTTMDAGYLVPVYVDEVLPGDTFEMKTTAFARFATPLKPIMDNLYLDIHYFYVPNRLVWDRWQEFMGERPDSDSPFTSLVVPKANIDISKGLTEAVFGTPRIAPYFGIPINQGTTGNLVQVNSLPFRAYCLIYNEWFRDENLQKKIPFSKGDADVDWTEFPLAYRAKRRDYFCSALPWPQAGDPVYVPLGSTAPVVTTGQNPKIKWSGQASDVASTIRKSTTSSIGTLTTPGSGNLTDTVDTQWVWGTQVGLMTDLAQATAMTINDLRTAFQIQRLLERDARGGTRYIELILSHFGVHSDDLRLQRPELLGSGSSAININPVASTFANSEVPQGQLAGYGTVVGHGSFNKSFTEHGYVIGIASVRSEQNYQFGINRQWLKSTRYDYYWPALAHLGEQSIQNIELFAVGSQGTGDYQTWGYQERYAEYRYKPSIISGLFNSRVATSLDYWHVAQDWDALPPLNAAFLIDLPAIERVIAVPSEPHFLVDIWFSLQCSRPMPVYSVPGLIDHF